MDSLVGLRNLSLTMAALLRLSQPHSTGLGQNCKYINCTTSTCKIIRLCLNIISIPKYLFDKDTLKSLYCTSISPRFDYCSSVWNNCSITLQNKLQKLQNKASRIITCWRSLQNFLILGHIRGKEREINNKNHYTNNKT